MQYIASCWNQDGDPVELLKIADKVSRFRQCLKENPTFLQEKVKTYFKVGKLMEKFLQYQFLNHKFVFKIQLKANFFITILPIFRHR